MMDENSPMIERWAHPTEMDTAAQYTRCFCSDHSVWVQSAKQEETPVWLEFEDDLKALQFIHDMKNRI